MAEEISTPGLQATHLRNEVAANLARCSQTVTSAVSQATNQATQVLNELAGIGQVIASNPTVFTQADAIDVASLKTHLVNEIQRVSDELTQAAGD